MRKIFDEISKNCTTCGESKSADQYTKSMKSKDGLSYECRTCQRIKYKVYYKKNREKLLEKSKAYRKENLNEIMERHKKRVAENPDHHMEKFRRYRDRHPDRVKASQTKSNKKIRSTPSGKLNGAISNGIRNSLKKGGKAGRKAFSLVGYSLEDLIRHLDKLFQPGMTWENYGKWHVDHIIPISAHNYETPDDIDFKRAWALSNLQPLWSTDNLRKNAKLTKPFQPSLSLSLTT